MEGSGNRAHDSVASVRGRPSLVIRAIAFSKRRPDVTAVLSFWVLGLYLAFFAQPPALTEKQLKEYKDVLSRADDLLPTFQAALDEAGAMSHAVSQEKVWFWYWKPEARKRVKAAQIRWRKANAKQRKVESELKAIEREANSKIGIWSQPGMTELRKSFWSAFEVGKVYARRQTFLDAIYSMLFSREEEVASMVVKLIVYVVVNFTTGMAVSVFLFLVGLPSLLYSYGTGLVSGLLFFLLAAIAALSVVATSLGLLYGSAGLAIYTLAASNQRARRIAFQRGQRLHYA